MIQLPVIKSIESNDRKMLFSPVEHSDFPNQPQLKQKITRKQSMFK